MHSRHRVQWQARPSLHLSQRWRDWLTEPASLTSRLQASCRVFRVQRMAQFAGAASLEEQQLLGLPAARPVECREVLLFCDDVPVVFARTVVSRRALQGNWPFFHGLGNRSLGARLFVDPRVKRLPMRYATLQASHKLHGYARNASGNAMQKTVPLPNDLYARSSVFSRGRGKMLVTEIFLPPLLNLKEQTYATQK
jgi:chorismate--pyruvate lyase